SGKFRGKKRFSSFGSVKKMVSTVITDVWSHAAGPRTTLFAFNGIGSSLVNAIDRFPAELIPHPATQIIPHGHGRVARQLVRSQILFFSWRAKKRETHILQGITRIHAKAESSFVEIPVCALRIKGVHSHRGLRVAKIWIVETHNEILALGANCKIPANGLTTTEQIFFGDVRVEYEPVATAVTGADTKVPRRPFLDVHQQIHGIGLIRFLCRELHVFKISGSL